MKIKLKHNFINRAHDLKELIDNCYKLSTFCNRLEKQSLLYPNRYDPDKYKGDGFELLVEALIKLSPIDNRIGIGNYEPIQADDTGVDGIGIGIDNEIATVQIKYRSNSQQKLTANKDHLSNFVMTSLMKYKVNSDTKTNMLIITTADGLHHFTDNEMFLNQVRCIGYKQLRELLDNNKLFWNNFKKLLNFNK